ncbi:MAG: T9SS type A sorting domain-containing protein [Bacteroidetes bacterium]|nr:T9SS type A sorting domain-containing protein [Bacteroidota bacterium]
MKKIIITVTVIVFAIGYVTSATELKQKKGFKIPENTSYVVTTDINSDKVKDYIVQSPEKIDIYSGKNNTLLYSVQLDSKSDESFLIDFNNGRFNRPDLLKDLNGNGVIDIPIRGLSATDGEYLHVVDPQTSEQILNIQFAPNSDNLYIYDVDGNDTLDVVIERLDSVLIFSSTVLIPSSVLLPSLAAQQSMLESYPNPTNKKSIIIWKRMGSIDGEKAVASIIDMQGREVRKLSAEVRENNVKFEWDGNGENSAQIEEGVYFVKVTSRNESSDGKIIVVR